MNKIYRVVWNAKKGCWTAAGEIAQSRGPGSSLVRAGVGLSLLAASLIAQAADPSVTAAGGNTRAYVAPNGVTVVDIATPNAAGVSNNLYTQFNVNAAGLVLNNGNSDQIKRQSQLAGTVYANINLSGEASLILNQVTGTSRSTLAGFTEVLGKRADVVVANPFGITCAGCGFINTDRVTLSTGLPRFNADGSLGGFTVTRGDIAINGSGLNASAQQILDLVSRSVRLDGQVNALSLGIYTGANVWDYGSRSVTGAATPEGAAPTLAIDSSLLGGMYANRIVLVSTEAGVGVRMLGDAAATAGDFSLTSAGQIQLNNKLSASGNLAVTARGAGVQLADASLNAGFDLALASDGAAQITGSSLVAGRNLGVSAASLLDTASSTGTVEGNNTRHAGGALTLDVQGSAAIDGTRWGATGVWQGTVGSLSVGSTGATLDAGAGLQLSAKQGDLALGTAAVQATGDLTLAATGAMSTVAAAGQGVVSSAGNVVITAAQGLNNAGAISADAGQATLRIGQALTNSGAIHAAAGLDIADNAGEASESISNVAGGRILTEATLALKGASVSNAAGAGVQAAAGSHVQATSLDNGGNWLLSTAPGAASDSVAVSGALSDAGTLQSARALRVQSGSATIAGKLLADGDLSITSTGAYTTGAGSYTQSGGALALNAGSVTNAGVLKAQALTLTAGNGFANSGIAQADSGNAVVHASGAIANSGTLYAATNLDIADATGAGTESLSNSGTLQSAGSMQVAAAATSNTADGWVQAGDRSSLTLGSLDNQGTWLLSTHAGSGDHVVIAGALADAGALQSVNTLALSADHASVTGKLLASGNLDVTTVGAYSTGANSFTQSGQALAVAAGSIDNAGVLKANAVTLTAQTGLANSGTTQADTGAATLRIGGTLDNSGTVYGATGLDIADAAGNGSETLTNSGALQSDGSMSVKAGTSRNTADGWVQSAQGSTVALGSVDNAGTWLLSTQAGSNRDMVTVTGALADSGTIQSVNALTVNAGSASVVGKLLAGQDLAITATGSYTTVAGSYTQAGQGITLAADSVDNSGLVKAATIGLTAQHGLANSGTVQADVGSATLRVGDSLDNSGTLYAATALDIADASGGATGTFHNSGTVLSDGTLALQAQSASNTASGWVQAAHQSTVNAASLDNAGTWLLSTAAGTTSDTVTVAGVLNDSGKLQSANTLGVSAASAQVDGLLMATGNLGVSTTGAYTTGAGSYTQSGQTLTLHAATISNAGVLKANALALTAQSGFGNTGTAQADTGATTVRVGGSMDNSGTLYAATTLDIADTAGAGSESLTNSGTLIADGRMDVKAGTTRNTGWAQAATGSGITAASLDNGGTWLLSTSTGAAPDTVTVAGALTDSGTLQSANALTVQAASGNVSGKLLAVGDLAVTTTGDYSTGQGSYTQSAHQLTLAAAHVANAGVLKAADLSLTASNGLDNSGTAEADTGTAHLRVGGTLANSGSVYAGNLLDIADAAGNGSESLANSGTLLSDGRISARAAATSNDSGAWVQSAAGSALSLGSLSNAGTWLLSTGGTGTDTVSLTGALSDSGTLQSAQALTLQAASGNVGGKLLAQGTLTVTTTSGFTTTANSYTQSTGALALTASSVNNGGTLKGSTLDLSAASGFTNSGRTEAGTGAAMLRVGGTLDNQGTLYGASTIDIADAGGGASETLTNSGTLFTDGNLKVKAGAASNNASGWIQAATGSDLSLASVSNAGTLLLSTNGGNATDTVTVSGAVDDSGTLQSSHATRLRAGSLTVGGRLVASGDLTATVGGTATVNGVLASAGTLALDGVTTLTNNAGGVIAGNKLTVASGTVNNSGTIQGGSATGSSLAATGTVTNNATGVIAIATSTAGNGTVSGATIVNAGKIQSAGSMTVQGGNGGLANSGTVLADGTLTVQAQAGTTLDVTQTGSAVLQGGVLNVNARQLTLNNSSSVQSLGDMGLTLNGLSFGASSARIVAGRNGSGTGTITVASALTDNAGIYSGSNLAVNAPGVTLTQTGGMAAAGNLTVTSTGDISNSGALFAGGTLTANASGHTITNVGDAAGGIGTIDAGSNLVLTASTLVNNSRIDSSGNITINAGTIHNDTPGGDTRYWGGDENVAQSQTGYDSQGYNGCNCVDQTQVWYYEKTWTQRQYYGNGATAIANKPQIIGNGTVTLTGFNTATNLAGVLSGSTLNITGNSGASFTNDDLALQQKSYKEDWQHYIKYIAAGPATYTDDSNHNNTGAVLQGTTALYSPGAGVYANNLNVSNVSLTNTGSAYTTAASGTSYSAAAGSAAGAASVGSSTGAHGASTSSNAAGVTARTGSTASADTGVSAQSGSTSNGASGSGARTGSTAGAATASTAQAGSTSNGTGATGAGTASTSTGTAATGSVAFGGINITLPTNPNGYFVPVTAPGAHYLVEANPVIGGLSASFGGSNYMLTQLGFNPDTAQTRLGDANYEAYLVQQQLIAQTGGNLLAGFQDQSSVLNALVQNGVTEARTLGLTVGQQLSAQQVAALNQDIVWMVSTQVGGQTVLVPQVYLSPQTIAGIQSGAVLAGNNVSLDVTSLTNTGGTIVGRNSLDVRSAGDITNLSGTITGGTVNLDAAGSIVNQTVSQGSGNDQLYVTSIGKQAGISSTGDLGLTAGKDITNLGASMTAGGNANLSAGGAITFDTIQNRNANTTHSSYDNGLTSGTSTTTTTTVDQVKSGLTAGGNLNMTSGRDITLAGTDAKVGGDASLNATGNVDIIARANSTTTHSESTSSGLGVGGGLVGTTATTTDAQHDRNVGSSLTVGGNATVNAGGDLTLQGSSMKVQGDGTVNASNVNVLAGLDSDTSHTTTKTSSFLGGGGAGSSGASANAGANASATGTQASTGAQAGAQANAGGTGGVVISQTTTTTNDTTDTHHVASTLDVGGNLTVNASKDVAVQGSKVSAGGNATINATNVNVLAAEDVHTSTTSTTSTAVGFMGSSDNHAGASAGADASANAGGANASAGASTKGGNLAAGVDQNNLNANASAQAQANAASNNDLTLVRSTTDTTSTLDVTHQGSSITSGGNLSINAGNNLTTQGSSLAAGNDVKLAATNLSFQAVNDVHQTTTSSSTTSAGLFANGTADASAKGNAGANGGDLSASASGSAQANADASVGIKVSNTQSGSTDGSTTAVTSSITAGGNINRNATGNITDVGTQITAGGNLNQSANTITSLAAQNTTYSSNSTTSNTGTLGVYAGASASASADASVKGGIGTGAGQPSTDTSAGAGAGVGVRATYQYQQDQAGSASSNAVVSNITVGGKVNSTSQGTTTLQGTNINAGGDVNLAAGSLDYRAAANTTSNSTSTTSGQGQVQVAIEGTGTGANGGYSNGKTADSSSTAVVGSLTSGGNLKITTTGDTRLEGTNLASTGTTGIAAGGNVTIAAAQNTSSSSSSNIDASLTISADKSGAKGGKQGASAEGGYSQSSDSGSEAVAGSINAGTGLTISSGKDTTLVGTAITSGGDASISAGGNLNYQAAQSTQSSQSFGVEASVGGGKETSSKGKTSSSSELGVSGEYAQSNSTTQQGGSIAAAGNLNLSSGGNTTLVGTAASAGGQANINAGGKVDVQAAVSTTTSTGVSASLDASKSKEGSAKAEKEGGVAGTFVGGTSSTAQAASLQGGTGVNVTAGGDASFQGTQIASGGNVGIQAGGNVTLGTANSSSVSGSIGGSAGSGGAMINNAQVSGSDSKQTVNIQNAGNLTVNAGGTVALQGTQAQSDGTVTVAGGGGVKKEAVVSGGGSIGLTTAGAAVQVQTVQMNGAGRTLVQAGPGGAFAAQIALPANLPAGTQLKASTADGKPLPTWLKVDPSTGQISGTPPAGFKGTVQVNVTVPQPGGASVMVPLTFSAP
ncbi:hemagglutinin repeat-containing protein [Ramlibacter sp.]|uniref:hemagglutinin repeat-containing protein n=1 Tax=Ramlibacter sp. TaxID=1917967 RepID=UPI002605EFDC|nr:hemagglutinin repeat-containing protein [Ramlibacter sp.]MDB5954060.1 hypothetical protein [Ramlibacter sp.]